MIGNIDNPLSDKEYFTFGGTCGYSVDLILEAADLELGSTWVGHFDAQK